MPTAEPWWGQRWVHLGIALGLGVVVFFVLQPFLTAMSWAAILAYATWPVFRRVERALGGRGALAALVMTVLFVLVVLLPVILVTSALVVEVDRIAAGVKVDLPVWQARIVDGMTSIPRIGPLLAERLAMFLGDRAAIEEQVLARVRGVGVALLGVLGSVGQGALHALVTLVTLAFLYLHGERLAAQVRAATWRAGGERMSSMFALAARTVRAVIYGTLLTAIVQGALIMLGCWMAGVRAPVLLGSIAAIMALTPIGPALVYVPVALTLAARGRWLAAGLLLAWGVVVVGTADNVIRSWFVSGAARIPVFFSLFGALGGLVAFGAIGLFVGPIALALALTLWREWTDAPEADAVPGRPA